MTLMNRTVAVCALLWLAAPALAQSRWKVDSDGGITWEVKPRDAHQDQIEMSGRKVSAIVTYGVRENGALTLTRQVVFPSLRTIPNDTHASLSYNLATTLHRASLSAAGPPAKWSARIHHRGMITVDSMMGGRRVDPRPLPVGRQARVPGKVFVSPIAATRDITVEVESTENTVRTSPARGVTGEYMISSRGAVCRREDRQAG